MSTINSTDGFVYTPSGEEAQKLEAEQRKGFFDDIALATDWLWAHHRERTIVRWSVISVDILSIS